MPHATANGISLYYEQQGEGPDLVLIMGLGANLGAWALNTPAFARHYRTLTFDNRGAGRSDAPAGNWSIRDMAADTAALMEALGIARAHIVGVSMGGMIAQELAIGWPGRVDRLVIACSRARASALRRTVAVAQRALWEAGIPREAIAALQQPWGRTTATLQDERLPLALLELQAQDPYPIAPAAYLRQLDATIAHDTVDRLGQISAPTLVLVGAEDILTPPYESIELARLIPGAELRILPRGGHGFNGEYPKEFNQAVLDFLRR